MQQKLPLTVLRALAVTFSLTLLGSYVVFSQRQAQGVSEPAAAPSPQVAASPSAAAPVPADSTSQRMTWIISGSKSFAGPVIVADQLTRLEFMPPSDVSTPPPPAQTETKPAKALAPTLIPGSKYGPVNIEPGSIIPRSKSISQNPTQKITLPGIAAPPESAPLNPTQGPLGSGLVASGHGTLTIAAAPSDGLDKREQATPPSVIAPPGLKPSQVMISSSKSGAVFFAAPSESLSGTLTITAETPEPKSASQSLAPRWDLREALDDMWKRIHLGLGLVGTGPDAPEGSTSPVLERSSSPTMPLPASSSLTPLPQP